MSELHIRPIESLGHGFIEGPHVPPGQDEHYLRSEQSPRPHSDYRPLRADEIETLVRNGNTADHWDNVLVTDQFEPRQVAHCQFYGLVRIGRLERVMLEYHELCVPVGLTNSRLIACDVGDDVAIHNVRYLGHYIVADNCILLNLDEMHTTNHAKFGNGIVKEGEPESVRVWMDLINEAGGRRVAPFDGMTAGDAWLWARHRDDPELLERLKDITQRMFDARRGFYGTVGARCVIKNSRIIKDVRVGECCYIKGANKLKNLTINSTADEPTQIGEGVELVNGIVGAGCHIFYGCKAVRFVMGQNSTLKYGARLVHSYLGDNSTVSCCEILNNLVFPAHEQHHNNSFLIASLVMGQSNVAACATIGSNHNSRAPDGEIHAGRGFWPGLCVSVKHNCRFASYVLLAKGDYPAEMNIPLPFSLVSNDAARDQLQIMPAYWWCYNMYALARNRWKFTARDRRKVKTQNIEFDFLAPDTAEEMFHAVALLERWTAQAAVREGGYSPRDHTPEELAALGSQLLTGLPQRIETLEVFAEGLENSRRKVAILKVRQAHQAYLDMLHLYAVANLLDYLDARPDGDLNAMGSTLAGARDREWLNLGGQLVRAQDLAELRADIKGGKLEHWRAIHGVYDRLWERYPLDKQRHAYATLLELLDADTLSPERWREALGRAAEIQRHMADQTYRSRQKDFDNPYRQMCYETAAEMQAVLSPPDADAFIHQMRTEAAAFAQRAAAAETRAG